MLSIHHRRRRPVSIRATFSTLLLAVTVLAPAAERQTSFPYSNPGIDPVNTIDPGVPGYTGPDGAGVVSANNIVNPAFVAWATEVVEYAPAPGVSSEFGFATKALGPVTGDHMDVVSLGDLTLAQLQTSVPPGRLILGFDWRLSNGPGPDFAVFENAFIQSGDTKILGELGYVEVSSNGVDFARFPSDSQTPATVGPYGILESAAIYNLVGKHINNSDAGGGLCVGTPFNLDDLAADPLVVGGQVDLSSIRYIRIVDIPGNGAFLDAQGDPIYDAWPTSGSGGVDIEAIGLINGFAPSAVDSTSWSNYQ